MAPNDGAAALREAMTTVPLEARHPVLLVADDPNVLRHAIVYFPRTEYHPIAARAGFQVTEGLAGRHVALAVVHQDVADMDGVELCRWLRENGDPAIVLLTNGLPPRSTGDSPYDVALKFPPVFPAMFEDTVYGTLREKLARSEANRDAFVTDVRQRVAAMESQDYYAMFGLPRGAHYDQIRDAYDRMSLQYHPDQHPELRDRPQAAATLNDYYKRIGEAYRILTHNEKRPRYDKGLANGVLRYDETKREKEGPVSIEDLSENARAKRFLKLAQVAYTSGNLRSALQNLKFAQSMDNNEDIQAKVAEITEQLKNG